MRKILFATLALAPMLLVGGQPQKQLNVFELPVSKLPSEKFIIEAAFSKEVETDCNTAYGNTARTDGSPAFWEGGIPSSGDLGEYEPRIYFGQSSPSYSIVGGDDDKIGRAHV